MKPWSFTITRRSTGYHWIVEHGTRRHAEGIAGDYDTAWLDSHDAIPDKRIVTPPRVANR